ncbi:MAG: hypothetical protein R3F30_15855 [Planctomycetota bacterium]
MSAQVREALAPDRSELRPLLDHVGGYRGSSARPWSCSAPGPSTA